MPRFPSAARKARVCASWLLLCLCCFSTRARANASVLGVELALERSQAGSGAARVKRPLHGELVRRLASREAPRGPAAERLELSVHLDADGSAFTAQILVGGRRQGERRLSAEGPSCESLRDVLIVSLLLLIDDDAESDAPLGPPRPVFLPVRSPTWWLAVGGAATHGLPSGSSSAWYGEVALRGSVWDLALAGLWAPRRSASFEPGSVDIRTLGGRLRACYVVDRRQWRWGGCAFGVLSRLSAHGRDFSNSDSSARAWLLLGLGPELHWSPLPRFGIGVSGQLLASPQTQSFSIHGLPGAAYRTDRVVGWLGAGLSVQLW